MYYATLEPNGNYVVYKDGQRVSTTSASGLSQFGLSKENLGSPTAQTNQTTQTSTTSPTITANSGTYYKDPTSGSYFTIGASGPQPVTDQTTLQKLQSGQLSATQQSYVGSIGQTGQTGQTGQPSELDALLQGLSPDQQSVIKEIYNLGITNDTSRADALRKAIAQAMEASDPYFKAQLRLAQDALERSLQSQQDDLSFREGQMSRSLAALTADVEASRGYLSYREQQELKDLATKEKQTLNETRENMAGRGLTFSSINARKQQMVEEQFGDVRESTRRSFAEQQGQIGRQLTNAQTSTQAELERLRQLAQEGRISQMRQTEQQIGSEGLSALGYQPLGGVVGTIPESQRQYAEQQAPYLVF
jgi:hypothetical protein